MKSMVLKSVAVVSTVFALNVQAGVHWGYTGEVSPENWAKLSPDYQMCSLGQNQSPVDLQTSNTVKSLKKAPIKFKYDIQPDDVVNNGHTLQIDSTNKGNYIVLDGQKHYLRQFHFHTPSENKINGKRFPMEAHFVNISDNGHIAVVAVMYELGRENIDLNRLLAFRNSEENQIQALKDEIKIKNIMPKKAGYYRFSGSLTTPPCTEGVTWIVLKQHAYISKSQFETFEELFHHDNARPVQPLNGRLIVD